MSGGVAPLLGSNETEGAKLYAIYRNAIHEMNEEIVLPEWKMLSSNLKNAYEKTYAKVRLVFPARIGAEDTRHRW